MEGEMPPEWMWPLVDEINEWFEEVDRARKVKYGGQDTVEEPDDMAQNELSRSKRRR